MLIAGLLGTMVRIPRSSEAREDLTEEASTSK
jgi:hypothetical protein